MTGLPKVMPQCFYCDTLLDGLSSDRIAAAVYKELVRQSEDPERNI